MQDKCSKEKNDEEVEESKNKVLNNEIKISNSQIRNHNSNDLSDQFRKNAYNNTNIVETSEQNILSSEKSKNDKENDLSTCNENYVYILKYHGKDVYNSDNSEIKHNEKNVLSKNKEKIMKKENYSPSFYSEKLNCITNIKSKNEINENFRALNKVKNNNMKSTNDINDMLYYKENLNDIIMKKENIGKKLSYNKSINSKEDNEIKENLKEDNTYIKNDKNRQNGGNIKNNDHKQNNMYLKMNEKEQNNTLIKKKINIKNDIPLKKQENEQNNIIKNNNEMKSKENINRDQILGKTEATQNGYLDDHDLKNKNKKKKEDCSDNSNESYISNNLYIKNNYDIEKNTKSIQKENINKSFNSSKINNELNALNLRKKNNKIIKSFENFSKNANKENIFNNSNKVKNNKKKILQSDIIKTNDLQKKSSEEVMIQKIFINESDTDDKVQKKIYRIEHNMEEKENKIVNNNMKMKRETILEKKNEKEKFDFEIELSSIDSSILSNNFTKKEESEETTKSLTHKNTNKNKIDENTGIMRNKNEKEDIENFNSDYNSSFESDTSTQKKKLNKNKVLINEELKNENSLEGKKLQTGSSNYSDELIDIKIYDDSEVDELKNSELESFWNNKDVSTILNESKYDYQKYSNEANEETVIWNSENYNTVEITNKKLPYYEKERKTQAKRCKSDTNIYKRKNDITLKKKSSIDDIIVSHSLSENAKNNGNTLNPILNNNNNNSASKEKKEDIDIASKLDVIKSKLALNNNIDINNINFESFDIYQIDFEKLGLNVDNLDKEEKYILMLYISEKKLEFVWNEREAFKRAHSNIKNFQANQNKIREMKNIHLKNNLLNENNETNDNCSNRESYKKNYKSNDTQYFKLNSINAKKEFGNEKKKKLSKSMPENINENEYLKYSISYSSDLSTCKITNEKKIGNILKSNDFFHAINSNQIKSNDNSPQYGFFFEFYHKLLKKYSKLNKVNHTSNEKIILEKFLKGCIYSFFQDEYIENFLTYYEDIKKLENKADDTLKNLMCVEYMCNSFRDIYENEKSEKKEEIMFLSSYFMEIMGEVINKFLSNDNLIVKLKQIQIINRTLKEEIKTYAIKVANHDIYFDVEPNFIEEAEKAVIGKDIGIFNVSILDKNYKYNYYIYQEEMKLNELNKNSVWNYFFGYINDIFYWYHDENVNSLPTTEEKEVENKDITTSKRFSRNFIKLNVNKEESNGSSEPRKESKNFLKSEEIKEDLKKEENETNSLNMDEESKDSLKNEKKRDTYLKNEDENKDIPIIELNEMKSLHVKETNEKNSLEHNENESFILIENKKILSNIGKNEIILSNSTKIEDDSMESNISNADNFISENSNTTKIDYVHNLDNKSMHNILNKEVKYEDDIMKYPNNYNSNNKSNPNNNENPTKNKDFKHKNNLAHLVTLQYRGSFPKEEKNSHKKNKNKNIIGSYFSFCQNESLNAVHIKNENIEQFLNAHFIVERCQKYDKEINKSYVHILNSKNKKYLAVNLENEKIIFTNKYDDTFYIDEYNVKNKISTYFELHSVSSMMKNILIEGIIQGIADIMLN